MYIIITLFYLSLITIVAMVSWKLVSLRKVNLTIVEGSVEKELHSNLYQTLERGWHVFRSEYLAHAKAYVMTLFYAIAKKVLGWVLRITQKIQAKHGKWYDMVKGKGVIKKKGSVSFFLQDVAEYKKSLQDK